MNYSKKILLLVDNDEDWLELLERFLKGQGFEVLSAQDHAGALTAAGRARPHCAVVDVKLGGEDGLKVCESLKAAPGLENVPVILMSGLDSPPEGSACDAFFYKADGVERLLSVIKKLLSL